MKAPVTDNFIGGYMTEDKEILQWHPAFFAGIQIELAEEADELTFDNEYQLGTKPKQIDVLVVKKNEAYAVKKNIGRIFRKYNIIEYKSPPDYLSIDDFYIGYAYACLYKTDTAKVNERGIGQITLTYVTYRYPKKLMKHFSKERGFTVTREEKGIYYVSGDHIPVQIIVTKDLSEQENLWLRVLSDKLNENELAQRMLQEYERNRENILYSSVMDIVVKANKDAFMKEGSAMCEELDKIINAKLDAREERGRNEGRSEGENDSKRRTARNLIKMGMSIEQIAEAVEEDISVIKEWIS